MRALRLLIEFTISFLSTMGFALITNIPKRALFPACLTGALAWLTYYVLSGQNVSLILPNFLAALVIGLLGNSLAVVYRVPVNTIYTPSLVSLVPGSVIYLGIKNLTTGNADIGKHDLFQVGIITMSLAIGFVCSKVIYQLIHPVFKKYVETNLHK